MSDEQKDPGPIIYTEDQRREFLLATNLDGRNRYIAPHGEELTVYYGFAASEHQFRKALCEMVFPEVKRITQKELHQMLIDDLKMMGAV